MPAKKIDGREIALAIHREIGREAARLFEETGQRPGLATVLIGADPASISYVTAKKKACERDGIRSIGHELRSDVSQLEVLELLGELACDPLVHGILLQLPLPEALDERVILAAIPVTRTWTDFILRTWVAWVCGMKRRPSRPVLQQASSKS